MSDLISYSIMRSPSSSSTTNNSSNSSSTLNTPNLSHKNILPSLNLSPNSNQQIPSISQLTSYCNGINSGNDQSNLKLPPINMVGTTSNTNYTSRPIMYHQPSLSSSSISSITPQFSNNQILQPSLQQPLQQQQQQQQQLQQQPQEETIRDCHGLGLLSSAIILDQQQQLQQSQQQFFYNHQNQTYLQNPHSTNIRSSSVPSLISSSSPSSSSCSSSSPSTPEFIHSSLTYKNINININTTPKSSQISQQPIIINNPTSTTTTTTNSNSSSSKSSSSSPKRRQRLGPSCDSCRTRKVKCNAEIQILSISTFEELISEFNLNKDQIETFQNQKKLNLSGNYTLLQNSNEKFIKFKNCNMCNCKKINCSFSNGFTKEEILNKKKIKKQQLQLQLKQQQQKQSHLQSQLQESIKSKKIMC
ncbi:SUT1 [Candida pseudojiufengensis]|uniref:SUT1 n=1 Tax=Candida pseudojiufengensis TaxID=497109 RepID=UPI00222541BD|nr:SUT1 [Candida pseudojiufengensis]KAI5964321.1 SUT1 [Candida pseudojiufengensis]